MFAALGPIYKGRLLMSHTVYRKRRMFFSNIITFSLISLGHRMHTHVKVNKGVIVAQKRLNEIREIFFVASH